jgi:UDP-N-acetylmuramyl pentapeptide phosphotransferase/UDP-N-acetylglucosamine-1-phosphate transferase
MISLALLLYQLGLTPFSFWIWILLLFIATGIINAFNFMDGINGITSSYSLSVLLGLWIVNNYLSMFICNDLLYSVMLSIALLGFYNFRTKAYCFAGDVGSVSISFALVFLIGELIISSDNPIYIMFMIIYGIDTFLTIVFRLIRHEKIFDAHRNHLYQILANELSISHLKVSTSYALTQFFINIFLIFIVGQLPKFIQFLISLGIIAILAYTYIYIIGKRFVRK